MDNRKETAEKIITALTNRSGFNDLWYNIDEEIQAEITDEIVNILPIHDVVQRSEQLICTFELGVENCGFEKKDVDTCKNFRKCECCAN